MKHLLPARNLLKHAIAALAALLAAPAATAQDFSFAERVFGFLREGRGDSICARLAPKLRQAVTPETFGRVYAGLEQRLGPLNERGAWRRDKAGTTCADYCRLRFGETPLKLTVVTDDSLRILSLTMTPLPATETVAPPPGNGTARDVTVENGDVRLPGTLVLPKGRTGRVPVIVLVHGSGPNDRDETLGPNKLFRALADSLAKAGIATLRYDKRTYIYRVRPEETGGCTDYDTETVDDAVAAVRLAASQPEADSTRIFVAGHSLGAMLAPRIANRSHVPVAGVIALAAPARPLETLLREQLRYVAGLQGGAPADVESTLQKLLSVIPETYLHTAREYNATAEAAGATCPMLFVQGGHDYQVTAEDFGLWKTALVGHDSAEFAFFPTCDHLMRETPRMAVPTDYMAVRPLSAAVVKRLVRFVTGR